MLLSITFKLHHHKEFSLAINITLDELDYSYIIIKSLVYCSNKYYFRLIRFSVKWNKCLEYNEKILGEYAYKGMFLPIVGRVRQPGLKAVQLCIWFQGELKFPGPLKGCWLEAVIDLGHEQVHGGGELGNLLL